MRSSAPDSRPAVDRARATFLDDQAAAAADQAEALLSTSTRRIPAGHPAAAVITQRLAVQLASGDTSTCRHLSGDAPSVSVWLVAVPGRLCCPPCARTTCDDLAAPLACACCGATEKPLEVWFDRAGMVVLTFALCVGCLPAPTSGGGR